MLNLIQAVWQSLIEFFIDKGLITSEEMWEWCEHNSSIKYLPKFFIIPAALIAWALIMFIATFFMAAVLLWLFQPIYLKLVGVSDFEATAQTISLLLQFGILITLIFESAKRVKEEFFKIGGRWSIGAALGNSLGISLGLLTFYGFYFSFKVFGVVLIIDFCRLLLLSHKKSSANQTAKEAELCS